MDRLEVVVRSLVVISLLAFVTACGGGGGGSGGDKPPAELLPEQGILFDARLANVPYSTLSYTGKTSSVGGFQYKEGEAVSFSLGNYSFPAIPAKQFVSLVDLLQADSVNQSVMNLASLLQTIDDTSLSDRIGVPDLNDFDLSNLRFDLSRLDFQSQAVVQSMLRQYGPFGSLLRNEIQVYEHLYKSAEELGVTLPNPSQEVDNDNDGLLNFADPDDDNDGVEDDLDIFPYDATEASDADNDGIGDVEDTDDDNDGYEDTGDIYPVDPRRWSNDYPIVLSLWPNVPVLNQQLKISGFNLDNVVIEISGIRYEPVTVEKNSLTLIMPDLEPGNYEIKVTNSAGYSSKNIIVPQPFNVGQRSLRLSSEILSAASGEGCAIDDNGAVRCWAMQSFWDQQDFVGDSLYGVEGLDGSADDSTAVSVSVGLNHGCAIVVTGAVKCWGSGNYGQLGNGSDVGSEAAVAVYDFDGVKNSAVEIASGYKHTCALASTGAVWCWGDNTDYQLGVVTEKDFSLTPIVVNGFEGLSDFSKAVDIETSLSHVCAVTPHGALFCWGFNNFGQLGLGFYPERSLPRMVPGLSGGSGASSVVDVALGSTHSCALLGSGAIKCWGKNKFGQVGIGFDTYFTSSPVEVELFGGGVSDNIAVSISSGSDHNCALLDTNEISCWGENNKGQLGNGKYVDSYIPVMVNAFDSVKVGEDKISLALSSYSSCVLMDSGEVWCWGWLGRGHAASDYSHAPVVVRSIDDKGSYPMAVSTSGGHYCAINSDGGVECWGNNDDGQLGNGSKIDSVEPVHVVGLDGVNASSSAIKVALGYSHSCALLEVGRVLCWGKGVSGILGNGGEDESMEPVAVVGVEDAVDIVVDSSSSCALLINGAVKCWGVNDSGQLGNGTFDKSLLPVPV
ncbi:MAG TPA: hypothetical protein ENI05_05945, partial [Porticoccus sp.]|nr:hypothetical protein [Porticoccus sp.]